MSVERDRASDEEIDVRGDNSDRCYRYIGNEIRDETLGEAKPFYSGSVLDSRVADLRETVIYVHCNWNQLFSVSMEFLKRILKQEKVSSFADGITKGLVERFMSVQREKISADEANSKEVTYDAIQVYTSTEGYKNIYGLCNKISRGENAIASKDRIRILVFLVELINVDLHNYITKNPDKQNFEGVVYRGQTVTLDEMDLFRSLLAKPITERYVAIPLGLLSSTKNLRVAKKFINGMINQQMKDGDKTLLPMLYKIHVVCLDQKYIDIYKSTVPSSTMNTTYAVDIQNLSRHPEESEVLLRAPFLQILDLYEDENILDGKPCEVVEAVMVNLDRDLKSLLSLTQEENDKAREIMRSIVTIGRCEFAVRYCNEKDLIDDAEQYNQLLIENKKKLEQLIGKSI